MYTLEGNETHEPLCMFWMRKVGYMKNTKVCENERCFNKWAGIWYSQMKIQILQLNSHLDLQGLKKMTLLFI